GVTSGIGLATAELMVKKGMRVVGLARNEGILSEVGTRLGTRFQPLVADLASAEDRRRASEVVESMDEPLDVLINNAAGCAYVSPLEAEPNQLSELFEVNVVAPL